MSRRVANHFFYFKDDYEIPNEDDEETIDDRVRSIKYKSPICMYFNSLKELEMCNVVPKDVEVIVLQESFYESDDLNESASLYYQKVTEVLDGWKVKYEIKEPEKVKVIVLNTDVGYNIEELENIVRQRLSDSKEESEEKDKKISETWRFW